MTATASQSPASRLLTQSFIRAQIKGNIKAPRHWPLCWEFTGTGEFPAQRASNAENVSIWWRHHIYMDVKNWFPVTWRSVEYLWQCPEGKIRLLTYHTVIIVIWITCRHCAETEMLEFFRIFHHWLLQWELSNREVPGQPVTKISSKWWHRCLSTITHDCRSRGVSAYLTPRPWVGFTDVLNGCLNKRCPMGILRHLVEFSWNDFVLLLVVNTPHVGASSRFAGLFCYYGKRCPVRDPAKCRSLLKIAIMNNSIYATSPHIPDVKKACKLYNAAATYLHSPCHICFED